MTPVTDDRAVRRWGEMTWTEIRDLAAGRVAALLPVGAVEAHGPHLPTTTDVVIAEAMVREAAARLDAAGWAAVGLPAVSYTHAGFAAAFPGTISLRPETAAAVVTDIAESLASQGVAVLGVASAHLDPGHLASLRDAVEAIAAAGRIRIVFPDVTKRALAARLTDEFRSGACHAGRFEGSVVLAERGDLVRDDVRRRLAPNPASLVAAIRAGKTSFEQAGGPEAYFGAPGEATSDEGRATVSELGAILAEAILAASGAPSPARAILPS